MLRLVIISHSLNPDPELRPHTKRDVRSHCLLAAYQIFLAAVLNRPLQMVEKSRYSFLCGSQTFHW